MAELTPTDEVRAIDTRTESMKRAVDPPKYPRRDDDEDDDDPYEDPAIAELIARIDPHEYERWPLGHNQHPSLEPAYAIARVFASPGVSWLDLCRMGAQNRRGGGSADQLEYLRGWCDVANRDAGAAVMRLRPLMNASVLGMPAAIRTDIANIVVDAGDATFAQTVMSRARVDDLAVFDLVAAGFVEVGKVRDALEINERAISAHDPRRPADHCMRLARKAVLVALQDRSPVILSLGRLKHCEAQYRELLCWSRRDCDRYLAAHGIPHEKLALGANYKDWPSPTASTDAWLDFTNRAAYDIGKPGGEHVFVRALEGSLESANCTGNAVGRVMDLARWAAGRVKDPALRQHMLTIASVPETVCGQN